jgi:hypothetical protein
MDGPKKRSGCYREEKNLLILLGSKLWTQWLRSKFLLLLGIKLWFSSPRVATTVRTELFWLLHNVFLPNVYTSFRVKVMISASPS